MKPTTAKRFLLAGMSVIVICAIIAAIGSTVIPPISGLSIVVSCLLIELTAIRLTRWMVSLWQTRRISAQATASQRSDLVALLSRLVYEPDYQYSEGIDSHIVYDPADEHATMIIRRLENDTVGIRYEVLFMVLDLIGPAEIGNRYRSVKEIFGISNFWPAISYKRCITVYTTEHDDDPAYDIAEEWPLKELPEHVIMRITHAVHHWQSLVADT